MSLTTNEFYNKPIVIRNKIIPSRFFLASINTGFTKNGAPTEKLLDFHTLRSGNRIGISFVGNVAIGPNYRSNNSTAYFGRNLSPWKVLSAIIRDNGSVPGIQLGCCASKIPPIKDFINKKPENYIEDASNEFNSYSTIFLQNIINSYIEAASISSECGFKVIQINAAHGYLLSLSLSKHFNKRMDQFGQDRTFFLKSIIYGIKCQIPDIVLDVRISLLEGIEFREKEIEYKTDILKTLCCNENEIDILSISAGIYNINKNLIYPSKADGVAPYINLVLPFTDKYPQIIWNIAGNIYDLEFLRGMAKDNLTYSIGRSLIADYKMVDKYAKGELDDINKCHWCDNCHYYSNGDTLMASCLSETR